SSAEKLGLKHGVGRAIVVAAAASRAFEEHIMAFKLKRRAFLQLAAGAASAAAGVSAPFGRAVAAGNDAATIGWPTDVPAWDPNQRFTPDAQPIFKAVFDQPLDQD